MPKRMGEINPIDIRIGENLRRIRTARGISQEKLAAKLSMPISHQAYGKYETGINRLSCSTLAELAFILEWDIADFFTGVDMGKKPENLSTSK